MSMNIQNSVLTTIILLGVALPSAFAEPSSAIHVPVQAFSIGDFKVGDATLSEARSQLGLAHAYEHDEGLVRTLCYFYPMNQGVVVLELNASVLGGLQTLTGFTIHLEHKHPDRCSPSLTNLRSMSIGMGVKLGESERDFRTHIPIQFVRNNNGLAYDAEYKREMNDKELASMRRQWPDIRKPSFFDVVESVRVKFRKGALVYYEVQRTESY
jgi:hypothetical protein